MEEAARWMESFGPSFGEASSLGAQEGREGSGGSGGRVG